MNGGTGDSADWIATGEDASHFVATYVVGISAGGTFYAGLSVDSTTQPNVGGFDNVSNFSKMMTMAYTSTEAVGLHTAYLLAVSGAQSTDVYADIGRVGAAADVRGTCLIGTIRG